MPSGGFLIRTITLSIRSSGVNPCWTKVVLGESAWSHPSKDLRHTHETLGDLVATLLPSGLPARPWFARSVEESSRHVVR